MNTDEALKEIQKLLTADGVTVSDDVVMGVVVDILNYCNLTEFPPNLIYYAKRKIKAIHDYEADGGADSVFDIASQSEGDASWSFNITDDNCRSAIYGLSDKDKSYLSMFRCVRRG